MTLGKGAIMCSSTKQKLNTRSSTEAELVGVDYLIGHVLWTNHFLEAQSYKTQDKIILQDNQSSLLLDNNGHWSRGKRSKHI